MSTLSIERKMIGEFNCYVLSGSLIVSTMLELKKRITADLEAGQPFVALDLTSIKVIDSSGLGLISNLKKRTDERKGHCVLMGVPPIVLDGLQQTGFIGNVVIVKNEAEFKDNFIL